MDADMGAPTGNSPLDAAAVVVVEELFDSQGLTGLAFTDDDAPAVDIT
jgi:hypothetical protein